MEIKKEGADTVEIKLSANELMLYGLTYGQISYDNAQTKEMLGELMSSAKRHLGQRAERLMIEIFPAALGGCFIYFTKQKSGGKTYTVKCKTHNSIIYKFENSESLFRAIETLGVLNEKIKSCLFIYQKNYYLAVFNVSSDFGSFSEFGEKMPLSKYLLSVLSEHGKLICCPFALNRLVSSFI